MEEQIVAISERQVNIEGEAHGVMYRVSGKLKQTADDGVWMVSGRGNTYVTFPTEQVEKIKPVDWRDAEYLIILK